MSTATRIEIPGSEPNHPPQVRRVGPAAKNVVLQVAGGLGRQATVVAGLLAAFLTLAACTQNSDAGGNAWVRYRCDSGATVRASYPTRDAARVRYRGHTLKMNIVRSADGARYAGKRLEWWTKGTGPGANATLFRHRANGETGAAVERCREVAGR